MVLHHKRYDSSTRQVERRVLRTECQCDPRARSPEVTGWRGVACKLRADCRSLRGAWVSVTFSVQYDNQAEDKQSFFNCLRPAGQAILCMPSRALSRRGARQGKIHGPCRARDALVGIRHWQPVRAMWRIASTASRILVVGARRRGLSDGNNGSISRRCPSVASGAIANGDPNSR